jgi:hypothetical protein
MHPDLALDPVPAPAPDIPAAATLYLMSHYARRPCPLVAHAIAEQLVYLSQARSNGSSLALQKLADTLLPQWQHIACGDTVAIRH